MTTREPKSITQTQIEVIGRDGKRRGRLDVTSGNLTYFRTGAKKATLSLSLQNLISVLEREKFRSSFEPVSLGDIGDHGFSLTVIDTPDNAFDQETIIEDTCDPRVSISQLDFGSFQIEDQLVRTRKRHKRTHSWFAQIPVSLATQMLLTYIDKYLVGAKSPTKTDKDAPISKLKMQRILTHMLKKLD